MPPRRHGRRTLTILALALAPTATALAGGLDPASREARSYWAFQPIRAPARPGVKDGSRVRTPIDAFVLARLEEKGLSYSPDAAPAALLRRVHLDLTGLPPSPAAVEAYLADARPDAYERTVDALLASPAFGERWGRHWLDAAGYVDVLGGDNDAGTVKLGEGKWLYRDYVVRAFNEDSPYDRFLLEQLAGDELADWRAAPKLTPELKEALIATGFLRSAADDTDENELNTLDIRHGVLQRTVEVFAASVLGLTLQCAKCHDHKYDPLPQRDYYRLEAIFSPAFNPAAWLQPKDRALPDVSGAERAEIERWNGGVDGRVAELRKRRAEIYRPHEERLLEARLASLPGAIRADVLEAVRAAPEKRTEVQKYLASKFEAALKVKPDEVKADLAEAERADDAEIERGIASAEGTRRRWGVLQAVYDTGPPPATFVLRRGNHLDPAEEAEAGFPAVLCEPGSETGLATGATPGAARGASSGRRLALARWLTAPGSRAAGLTARVLANRTWQHLLGKGIVETADNFGRSGSLPTHPALLEWLAAELVRGGWRQKPLIRSIVTSTAYRQAAGVVEDDSLLAGQRLRRLESEVIRDQVLSAAGALDLSLGGAPIPLESRPDGSVVLKEPASPGGQGRSRRSLYVLARRSYHLSMLNVFDQPVVATSCACRSPSAVVTQSLFMLNDAFVLSAAQRFAARVEREAPAPGRVDLAFLIALGRKPSADEARWSADLVERHAASGREGLTHLCHMLLNTSEFLYTP